MSVDVPLTGDADDAPLSELPTETLVGTVVEYDDAPDECTVYPLHADEDERLTTWISAKDDSFVELDEMR
ncbi:hypothetical protein SAMN04487947_2936 [Halogeometricum rufum]|jgi:hypothetical protein|uniref:DUF7511 domain-containing protein n=1 Tax=Halogeometricum rufum TaxID=553469 RepID=A0A1I6I690_9EURY|nr:MULTISPECIES: hypothetical protein [Halogeometricum]MUV58260.1 hypothetical protein [Halogeometricum sp. CBA1124]SFR62213.1 hypothetical protein SAMN04487947_2936 [Halogeometricum rufum]